MGEMVPFRFGSFYDVPRTIVVRYRERLVLLRSDFDDILDEYPDTYSVYVLPDSVEESLKRSSWEFLVSISNCIGCIPVKSVTFDPSKSKMIDPSILDELIKGK